MLKGFIDLQKEQLEVDKAKAEAEKAKLELVNNIIFLKTKIILTVA